MKAFGDYLRRERELRGISLDEVAQSTKISASILENIEHGRIDSLPAIPFVKGFLRAYADYVGLDPASVVLRFEAAFLADEAEARRALGLPWARVRRVGLIAVAGVLAVLAVTELALHRADLVGLVHRKPKPPAAAARTAPATASPESPAVDPEEAMERIKVKLGLKEIERKIKEAPVEIPTEAPSASAQVPTSTAPGFRVPRRGPGDAGAADAGSTRTTDGATTGDTTASPPGKGERTSADAPREGSSVLVVHGISPTWVQIIPDDGPSQDRLLQVGDDWIVAARKFVLRVGDGGAVSLTLDGRELGSAGEKGVFVRRELPPPGTRPAGRR